MLHQCTFDPDVRHSQASWPPGPPPTQPVATARQLHWAYLSQELDLPAQLDCALDTVELGIRRAVRSGRLPSSSVRVILKHSGVDDRLACAVNCLKSSKLDTFVERELESVQIAREYNLRAPSPPQTAAVAATWAAGLRAPSSPHRPWRPASGRGSESVLCRQHRLMAAAVVSVHFHATCHLSGILTGAWLL
jgi:hypothetical protein